MKQRYLTLILVILLGAIFLTSCSGAMGASSWPGLSLADDNLYLSYSTSVFALNINDGGIIWRFPSETKNTIQFYAPVAVSNEQLVVGDYGKSLYSIDPKTGSQRWSFNGAKGRWIAGAVITDALNNGNITLAPNGDNNLYALTAEGQLLWTFEGSTEALWAQPVVFEGKAYQVSMDHSLYAIDLKTGTQDWSLKLDGAMVHAPLLSEGVLYISTFGNTLHAIQVNNQVTKWQFKTDDEVWGTPVLHAGNLYFADLSGKIYAVKAQDGSLVWTMNAGGPVAGSAVLTSDGLVFLTETGDVMLVNFEGAKQWTRSIEGKLYGNALIGNDRIIVPVVGKESLLVAYDLRGNEIWSFFPPK